MPRPPLVPEELSDQLSEKLARIRELSEQLRGELPEAEDEFSDEERARWLLSHLLEFYRREDKATYWEKFRLDALDDGQRLEEKSAIASLELVGVVGQTPTGIPIQRYSFPPQELTIKERDQLYIDKDTRWGTKIEAIDVQSRTIDVRKTKATAEVHPPSAFAWKIVTADPSEEALLRLAGIVVEDDDGGLALSLLRRELPAILDFATLENARTAYDDELELATALATRLDRTILGVQGPPGAGKTHTGAHMLLSAVQAGKKVGVTRKAIK